MLRKLDVRNWNMKAQTKLTYRGIARMKTSKKEKVPCQDVVNMMNVLRPDYQDS